MATHGSNGANGQHLCHAEAISLMQALVARVAQDAGIRVLFIKGPILAMQGLRPERPSVDVDVLVDPSRFEEMQQRFREVGWRIEVPGTGAHVMTFHSKAYRHDNWPCEIDVHDRFPGFFADPQDVFEALWARRTTAAIAGREVPCPDILGNAAIAALHALRDPSYQRSKTDLAFMTDALREGLDQGQLRELAELAVATGAADTLCPFLDAIGAPKLGEGTTLAKDLEAWQIRTSSSGVKTVAYLYQLRHAPKRQWLPILWHALVLTEAEVRKAQPDAAPGAWGLFKARVRRLRWGLEDLPRAATIVWRRPRADEPTSEGVTRQGATTSGAKQKAVQA
jgi:hypothetical protein